MADINVTTMMEVGKPFPWTVPTRGCILEMLYDGTLCFMIQTETFTKAEKNAFEKSFSRYGYLESVTIPPVAIWTWMFPPPLNPMDVNFNAVPVDQEVLDNYFELESNQVKNIARFYLLDGDILRGIKTVGLDPAAVMLFRNTIIRQTQINYSHRDYVRAVNGMFSLTAEEIFGMSVKFKK
ncbi:MAG: hypothetical protein HY881_13170 [Deltaproteobacteria bacterium]|nr:hypothetical protein [Deltaproteobacteria bacterium]